MKTVEVHDLVNQKEFPAISIVIPTHAAYPHFKADRQHMKEIINQVENKLRKDYSEEKTRMLIDRLTKTIENIDFNSLPKGLAVYVSPNVQTVINLPFDVPEEKVIVSDNFEIRDLVYEAKKTRPYMLVVLSRNTVKTYYGVRKDISQVELDGMPLNIQDVMNEHSWSGWNYFDTEAWKEKNLGNYIHFIDEVIEKELRDKPVGEEYPVIVMGDQRLLSYLNQMSKHPERYTGFIEGNYEHASLAELTDKIQPTLEMFEKKVEKKALDLLAASMNIANYAAGIENVWRTAAEKRCRLLLVEKGYHQRARHGEDEYTIIIDDEIDNVRNSIADAVDDIIEMAITNGGDVVFVEDGKLKDYERIACVTFY